MEFPHPLAPDHVVGVDEAGEPQRLECFVDRPEMIIVEIDAIDVRAYLYARKPVLPDSRALANTVFGVMHGNRAEPGKAPRVFADHFCNGVILSTDDFVAELGIRPVVE